MPNNASFSLFHETHNNSMRPNLSQPILYTQPNHAKGAKFQTRNTTAEQVLKRYRATNCKSLQAVPYWEGSCSETFVTCTAQALDKIERLHVKRM
jgi:hypothetical protein